MDELSREYSWTVLDQDDEALMKTIQQALESRSSGNPYGTESNFATSITSLPIGLKAMAATHWLDISLTLDSVTWHFGNFGEPLLVAETEAGLRELGLVELASIFAEARDLMVPLLTQRTSLDDDPYEILKLAGLKQQGDELDRRAWALDNLGPDKSVIYEAWIRYARQHPENVFDRLPD